MYRSAIRTAAAGLAINLTLGVVKLVGGIVGNSFALVSDAVNSIGDSLGSVIVLFALARCAEAARPRSSLRPHAGRGGGGAERRLADCVLGGDGRLGSGHAHVRPALGARGVDTVDRRRPTS